jgi:hypothetical protein
VKTKTVRELERDHDAVHALDMPASDKLDTLEGIEGEMVEAYAKEQQLEQLSSMKPSDIATLCKDPKAFDNLLGEIRDAATSFKFDVSTKKGRTTGRSIARKVSSAKVRMDAALKKETEEWARKKAIVDGYRRKAKTFCDNLRDEIKAPVVEWEERVAREKAEAEAEIQMIRDHKEALAMNDLFDREAKVRAYEARIAAEEVEKAEAERIAQIEAEAKAKAEADAAAALEAEREHARQKVIAAEKAAKEAQHRAEREAREAHEAAQRAAIAQIAEAERVAREERERQEADAQRLREEKAARAADKAHRNLINNQIIDYLVTVGVDKEQAFSIVKLIATGIVPHLRIDY